jgi:hypothetical protein
MQPQLQQCVTAAAAAAAAAVVVTVAVAGVRGGVARQNSIARINNTGSPC